LHIFLEIGSILFSCKTLAEEVVTGSQNSFSMESVSRQLLYQCSLKKFFSASDSRFWVLGTQRLPQPGSGSVSRRPGREFGMGGLAVKAIEEEKGSGTPDQPCG
jgi:hypothetical protein